LEALSQNLLPWPNVEALHVFDDSFVLLFPEIVSDEIHAEVIHRFFVHLQTELNLALKTEGFRPLGLRYGVTSSVDSYEDRPHNNELYCLITQAGRMARRHTDVVPLHLVKELQHLIQAKQVDIHYQPIWNLKTASIVGWEALARGPKNSELQSPIVLFDTAERVGRLLDIEHICRNVAIRNARIGEDQLLFLNISPNILSDPSFRKGDTRTVIQEVGLRPEQIVFEITEHHAIREYKAFLQLVLHYREQGYQIAIDDVGAGYSGLVTLMQVKPDYVKMDMTLIRGMEKDRTKQDIVRAIHEISKGFSGTVIAEGIETREELECVLRCGVEYGQGFLLGRPGPKTSQKSCSY
jgi:EAL domain-containing protein (putative c-di-GMP-specific phosphodiesterase class I)